MLAWILTFSCLESTPPTARNFFIFQVKMGCDSGQEGKFFYPEYFFLFVKPFKEGTLSQRSPVGLFVSLLNCCISSCCRVVVTDFARLGKMKNA